MSYNFSKSLLAAEVKELLPSLITDALKTATVDEQEAIQLSGQCVHHQLSDIDDDSLVDLQVYGSDLPSQGTGTFFISMNYRPTRTKLADQAKIKPWTPDQGPLALRTPTEDSAKNQE
jgi:hypothetical protein